MYLLYVNVQYCIAYHKRVEYIIYLFEKYRSQKLSICSFHLHSSLRKWKMQSVNKIASILRNILRSGMIRNDLHKRLLLSISDKDTKIGRNVSMEHNQSSHFAAREAERDLCYKGTSRTAENSSMTYR
jgi:hypothetical protein